MSAAAATSAGAAPLTLAEAFELAKSAAPELAQSKERIVNAEVNVARAWIALKPNWTAAFTFTHFEPAPEAPDPIVVPDLQTAVQNACKLPLASGTIDDAIDCIDGVLRELESPSGRIGFGTDFARQDSTVLSTRLTWTPLNGRAWKLIESAEDAVGMERLMMRATERTILLAIARAYYAAVATQDAIAAAERARARADGRANNRQAQADLGGGTKSTAIAADIAAKQAALDVRRASNTHALSLLGLAHALGLDDPREVARPVDPVAPTADDETLLAEALAHREDIHAARIALIIAERQQDAAWWRFAPTVSLFSSANLSNVEGLSGRNFQWSVGVVANLVLYDGGLRYTDLAAAESGVKTAQLALDRVERQTRRDLRRARIRVEGADIAGERAQQTLRLAEERVKVTQALLQAGAGREIELNEAYDQVADAELLIIRARLDRALAVLELQHAAGTFAP